MKPALLGSSIHHTYGRGDLPLPVLMGVDLEIHVGDCAALTGPSGSGEATLTV